MVIIMKKVNISKILCVTLFTLIIFFTSVSVSANSYVYDYWMNVIPSTEGITYKETYYNTSILDANGSNKSLGQFNSLSDFAVANDKIYLLDRNTYKKKDISLGSGLIAKEVAKISDLIIINQNFQYEKVVNQFKLSDYAFNKLRDYYHFDTPLDEITPLQFSSVEFVDVYDASDEIAIVNDSNCFYYTFAYDSSIVNERGTTLELTDNFGQSIDNSCFSSSICSMVSILDVNCDLLSENTLESMRLTKELISDYLQTKHINVINITEDRVKLKTTNNDNLLVDSEFIQFNVVVDKQNEEKTSNILTTINASLNIDYGLNSQGEPVKPVSLSPTSKLVSKITFTSNDYDGMNVRALYKNIDVVGRAPFAPYVEEDGTINSLVPSVYLANASGITVVNGYIYIADTENLRILKINQDTLICEDVFLTPSDSIFYQGYNASYQTRYGQAVETISSKNDYYSELTGAQPFEPYKLAVKENGVLYCISNNVYEGILEFSADTSFNRFLGKNEVVANAFKKIWSRFYTEKQLAALKLDLPAMFSNIHIASNGFLYATSFANEEEAVPKNLVKIINTKGKDVLKRNGYVTPDGDAVFVSGSTVSGAVLGSSVFTDIAVSSIGNYTVVDQKRGRLFTYDSEGNLLYITGEQPGGKSYKGSGSGLSNSIIDPAAIEYFYRTNTSGEVEETVLVLDTASSSLLLFETTEFGKAVNNATKLYQNGVITDTYQTDSNGNTLLDEFGNPIVLSMGAESYWRQVIKMNSNYELANLGIGKALNRRGEFKEAMKYFRLAHSAPYYSKAYSSYRDQVLNENFNLLMTVVVLIVALFIMSAIYKSVSKKKVIIKREDDKNE